MKEIDWSKAPEGTTHHVPKGCAVCAECWVRLSGGLWYFHDWKNEWAPWPKPSVETVKHLFIERPKAWSGEDLPPIGTVCEYRLNNSPYWYKCEVRYIVQDYDEEGTQFVIYCPHLDYEQVATTYGDELQLRPIKTQEQLVAEEREKAIKEMYNKTKAYVSSYSNEVQKQVCADLYDAGYRLTKTE